MAGIELTSTAFSDHAMIPRRYVLEGGNVSPPLSWSGVPDDAAELVLLCEDPDAPSGTFVHWTVAGIDPRSGGVAAGKPPPGGTQLVNGFGEIGWSGPHPPAGDHPHRYVFRLYALGVPASGREPPTMPEVRRAVESRQLASGSLVGLYQR